MLNIIFLHIGNLKKSDLSSRPVLVTIYNLVTIKLFYNYTQKLKFYDCNKIRANPAINYSSYQNYKDCIKGIHAGLNKMWVVIEKGRIPDIATKFHKVYVTLVNKTHIYCISDDLTIT